jgi:hypothetical protein
MSNYFLNARRNTTEPKARGRQKRKWTDLSRPHGFYMPSLLGSLSAEPLLLPRLSLHQHLLPFWGQWLISCSCLLLDLSFVCDSQWVHGYYSVLLPSQNEQSFCLLSISLIFPIYSDISSLDFMLVSCAAYSSTLKIEAIWSSETQVHFQRATRGYIQEGRTLLNDSCATSSRRTRNVYTTSISF